MYTTFLFLMVAGCVCAYPDPKATKNIDQPILTTPLGQVQGSILASRKGKTIYSFRGIPYAKPPVNELRFQPPVPVEKWTNVLNATQDAPLCPQATSEITNENCLFLNVYTTKYPKEKKDVKRPVIVYLHAGGFFSRGSASYWLGPQYLLDEEIVLVTLNYRLGALGFLSTGDKEAPGNLGLKDQVEALKWVQANIAAFGGNPEAVTLAGSSAGAAAVTLHMVSPLSKGLFHRVILNSGSSLGQWPVPNNQLDLAKKLAQNLACTDVATSSAIVKCLKTKTAAELGDAQQGLLEFGDDPILTWLPVVEPDHGQPRFLTQHPISVIQKGDFMQVPVMLGITANEFDARAFHVVANETLKKEMNANWEKVAPIAFLYERNTDNSKKISNDLKQFYLQNKPVDNSSLPGLAQLYSDSIIGFGVHNAAKLFAEKSNQSVYYYRFNYKGRYSHFYLPDSNGTVPYGVVHHDNVMYLFYIQKVFPLFKDTDQEAQTVNKMTLLWANFAATGNPIPTTVEALDNAKWEPFNGKTLKYLDIGNKLVISEKLYEKRYAEWEKLFPNTKYAAVKG